MGCPSCKQRGYILSHRADKDVNDIQRCDECMTFENDREASIACYLAAIADKKAACKNCNDKGYVLISGRVEVVRCLECKKFETDSDAATSCYNDAVLFSIEIPEKFLCVELMICYTDNTWNTDYIYIPYPEDEEGQQDDELLTKCTKLWEEKEEAVAGQRSSISPPVAHIALYNVNWDEPVDKDGERTEG